MALASIFNIACANRAEMFQRIRDFVCKRNGTYDYSTTGIGWTLVDYYYAVDENHLTDGDWVVMRTQGENSDFVYCLKLTYTTASYIKTRSMVYWNASTNSSGSDPGETTDYSVIYVVDTDTPRLCIHGNLDELIIAHKRYEAHTTQSISWFGRTLPVPGRTADILTATSTYTSGSDKSIVFNKSLPVDWVAGKKVFLWSNNGDGFNVVTLKTVNAGTKTITVDLTSNLPTSPIRASRHFGIGGAASTGTLSPYALIADDGTERINVSFRSFFQISSAYTGVSPDVFDGRYWAGKVIFFGNTVLFGISKIAILVAATSGVPGYGDTLTVDGSVYRVQLYTSGSGVIAFLETET